MSKIPYDFTNQNTTLVHICCSVDSHHFLTQLQEKYPNKNFCGFFYNPNIHPFEEYQMRLFDVKRSCAQLKIPLIEGEYNLAEWLEGSKGLENAPEKGKRCSYCFDFRLERSAQVALESHCVEFTTTLLASPMKSQEELFAQGETIANKHHLAFLSIDVRSNGGTQLQNKLARDTNLYRQNYCGCLYALEAQRKKSQKRPLELLSVLNLPKETRNLPALRLKNFQTRTQLEQTQKPYQIIKRKVQHYRILSGLLKVGDCTIPSFICNYSMLNKPIKAKVEFWQQGIGYANKEGILLLEFNAFKDLLKTQDFNTLLCEGLSDTIQLNLRYQLYPNGFFTSPIVIVNQRINQTFTLEIAYIMQEEVLEDFIPTSNQ
ncbi:epoxyqueuosine reductase QueH [Helicobacter turcicus]|uniref:Epoxyqueuosine reductase QueH n=1 Tax=Helicobacter turcicus TaxID=2867412 RepID=A0ABS7JM32_9HELI|nr:epoxyqueuosine reductase QueH [Helicobacter turcicus]MBX7490456.1 epoxyqueuosine reductase QueH [Helicobacter turcicus]MBX7545316.1 epoxyqueuosine reductase QueH [Helicobacter turcicus]